MTSQTYTYADFCQSLGVTPEWLASEQGNLVLDDRTDRLPEDKLVVGGNLTIRQSRFTQWPVHVTVGGYLLVEQVDIPSLPQFLDVKGDATFIDTGFASIHEGCHFHQSVTVCSSKFQHIHDHFHVLGDLILAECSISTLPHGLVVDRILDIRHTSIRCIPEDCQCAELRASGSKVDQLPNNRTVEVLDVSGCPLSHFPKGVRVIRDLVISYTSIREIEQQLPDVNLIARYAALEKLPDGSRFGFLDLTGCSITQLPLRLIVTIGMDISETDIRCLPDDSQVMGYLIAHDSSLMTLPEQMLLAGILIVTRTPIQIIPAGIICKAIVCDPEVQVDAYQFHIDTEIEFHPNGKYVVVHHQMYEVVEHCEDVWKVTQLMTGEDRFVVTDGSGKFADGVTPELARAVLQGIDLEDQQQPFLTSLQTWNKEFRNAAANQDRSGIQSGGAWTSWKKN